MTDASELGIVGARVGDESFDVTHYAMRGWELFVVRGDVRGDACRVVIDVLSESVDNGSTQLIVDLARVNAIDPLCVNELRRIDRQLRSAEGDFRLVVDGVAVLQAIRLAGSSGRFQIHRYVGDVVGAVPGIDEGGRGRRRDALPSPTVARAVARET